MGVAGPMNLWWRSAKVCCCVVSMLGYFLCFFRFCVSLIISAPSSFPFFSLFYSSAFSSLKNLELASSHLFWSDIGVCTTNWKHFNCPSRTLWDARANSSLVWQGMRHRSVHSGYWESVEWTILVLHLVSDSSFAGPNHIKVKFLCKADLTHFCPGVRRLYQSLALMTSTNANQAHQCASRGQKVTTCQWEFSISSPAELPVASLQVAVNQVQANIEP